MNGPVAKNAHLWARHPQDWYVEPQWCSARLFKVELFLASKTTFGVITDPSCGLGRIVIAARAVGYEAEGHDIEQHGDFVPSRILDFTESQIHCDHIVSNPPFGIADAYVRRALVLARHKIALLLPTKWMNSAKRGAWLETTPLRRVWLLAPRPSMPPGPVIMAGEKPGNGTVDFAWFVWEQGYSGLPELHWLRRDA